MVIVQYWINGLGNDPVLYGPFVSGDEATRWASEKFGVTACWGWDEVKQPD